MHYITYENLYDAVLKDINKHLKDAKLNKQELLNKLMSKHSFKQEKDLITHKTTL